jgi:hypothetical protein
MYTERVAELMVASLGAIAIPFVTPLSDRSALSSCSLDHPLWYRMSRATAGGAWIFMQLSLQLASTAVCSSLPRCCEGLVNMLCVL